MEVPFFQRAYVWNQDNWEELLNTLSQEPSSIFLGAVILQKREKDGSHVKSYAVIDGQQRLTTLSILLCACYDLVDIDSLPTLLLFWIELYRIKGALSSNEELKYRYSLEHVMPTKWQEHWNELPVYGDGDVVESDAWKREKVRARAIQGLGNMTILKKALNSKLRNKGFSVKKEEVLKNDLAMLSIASEVYSATAESWDERTIRARTKVLAMEIVKIWPLEVLA